MRFTSSFYTFLTLAATANAAALEERTSGEPTLLECLRSDPDLGALLDLIAIVPGLANKLNDAKNITILAPTNAAFFTVPPDSLEGQVLDSQDVASIAALLSYHVVTATFETTDLSHSPTYFKTLMTSDNVFKGEAATLVSGGQWVGVRAVDYVDNRGSGTRITSGDGRFSDVLQPNIKRRNAIVHKIDTVLTIPRNITLTAHDQRLSCIADALAKTGLTDIVNTAPDTTIFIPTDAAFEWIKETVNKLTLSQLTKVLSLHLVQNLVIFSSTLDPGTTGLPSAAGETLQIVQKETDGLSTGLTVNGVPVIFTDLILRNGVGHIIYDVLMPNSL